MPTRGETIVWPEGKKFAFTVVDDTDLSTVDNTKPVYDLLAENGLITTKTIWPLEATGRAIMGGHTLQNEEYRDWVLAIRNAGFEVALHGVADSSSDRNRVIAGFEHFREVFGSDPSIHTTHYGQREGMYWGTDRIPVFLRPLYRAYRGSRVKRYGGADPGSPYFWGDLCRHRVTFVRNLVFSDINTIRMDPLMPYHDSTRPYVPYWFSSSNGSGVEKFCALISEANQDRLVAEHGACIVYTHFGSNFYPLRPDFKRLIRRLGSLPGWFVPASTLLNHLGQSRGWPDCQNYKAKFQRMQFMWLRDRLNSHLGLDFGKAARTKASARR
jgi:hypothetical protein